MLHNNHGRNHSCLLSTLSICVLTLFALLLSGSQAVAEDARSRVYTIAPGQNDQYEVQGRLIEAMPGDVIQLEEGTYRFNSELNVASDNITIRGRGPDKTILSFTGQIGGSEGLTATGDAFVIEDLAVEDTAGNAIKVLGSDGVIFRRVRTEWTKGPSDENGAYGIYPVQCENVLIEDCVAIAAADAGIYVGQSKNVVVRRCRAALNVAGIEIENTLHADVYENTAENNTGGILVFDLPGLQLKNGGDVRVFKNKITNNNTNNFAPKGAMVGEVPPGSGLMIMATDRVQVFENEIRNNNTAGLIIVSFDFTMRPSNDPKYDSIPEGISVYDNTFENSGSKPSSKLAPVIAVLGKTFPDIIWDGVTNSKRAKNGMIPDEYSLKFDEEKNVSFVNLVTPKMTPTNIFTGKYKPLRDISQHKGRLPGIKPVQLSKLKSPDTNSNTAVAVYRKMPKHLSDWGFFQKMLAKQQPAERVIPYTLNTPLFSDYAAKYRFIKLPEGQAMRYSNESVFEFPEGTAIAKTFAYAKDLREPEKQVRLLETRVEFQNDTGWYGATYLWNEEQTDAELALGGGELDVTFLNEQGREIAHKYLVPNANQCLLCHSEDGKYVPIGPNARNLNRKGIHTWHKQNQLQAWSSKGLLEEIPTTASMPKLPEFDKIDSGTLASRARAWLEVNCAHCHNPKGSARTSGLDLTYSQTDPAKFGIMKSPVAAGRATAGRKYDIVPGKPDESILMYRIETSEPGVRMPSIGRGVAHDEAAELIRKWISEMPEAKTKSTRN